MACDDGVFGVDQDGITETELPDAGCDLCYLLIAVRACVASVGDEFRRGNLFNLGGLHP